METIQVILSLNSVGPRSQFTEVSRWPFCLRLSAGYSGEPTDAERATWTEALLPWRLFASASDSPMFRAYLVDDQGVEIEHLDLDVGPPVLSSELVAFNEELQNQIQQGLLVDPEKYTYSWAPPKLNESADVSDTENAPLLISGLLQGAADLPPDLSRGLSAAWYFVMPERWSANAGKPGVSIAVAPLHLFDTRSGTPEQLTVSAFTMTATSGIGQFTYVVDGGTEERATATGPVVTLSALLPSNGSVIEQDYWLPIVDNRNDSLERLEERIGSALNPQSLIAALPIAALAAELSVQTRGNAPYDVHAISKAFLQQARTYWEAREPASADTKDKELRQQVRVRAVLEHLKTMPKGTKDAVAFLRDEAAKAIGEWWTFAWSEAGLATGWPALMLQLDPRSGALENVTSLIVSEVVDIAALCIATLWPIKVDKPSPSLPNEAIQLRIGDLARSLMHESHDDAHNADSAAQIAAVGLLVRRAGSKADLTQRPWRFVTAGVAVLEPSLSTVGAGVLDSRPFGLGSVTGQVETLPHTPPIARGLPCTFVNDVLRNEVAYRGEHPGSQTPLRFVHDYEGTNESAEDSMQRIAPLTWQIPGVIGAGSNAINATKAPALRYGDAYQFAAFCIDRTGGMPSALVGQTIGGAHGDAYEFVMDWRKLDQPLQTSGAATLVFNRRVPVGELNILPGTTGGDWPALPDGVVLRSREWHDSQENAAKTTDNVAVLLLGDTKQFKGVKESQRFNVELPRVDEFTLSRWLMPQVELPPAKLSAQLKVLRDELERIHTRRNELLEEDPTPEAARARPSDFLPHDPAVAAIGYRITRVDAGGQQITKPEESKRIVKPDTNRPVMPNIVRFSTSINATETDSDVHIEVEPGTFCRLELFPLVTEADYARFEDAAFAGNGDESSAGLVEPEPWTEGGVTYRAFVPARVLIECAGTKMPDEDQLYDALHLQTDTAGRVQVVVDTTRHSALREQLAFVDRFTMLRQRWVWRNRPLLDAREPAPDTTDLAWSDWQRRMSGGLPRELWSDETRDTALSVLRFDDLASTDRGHVDRGAHLSRWPREKGALPPVISFLLADDRDAVVASDYLRYGLRVHSRYASIFLKPEDAVRQAKQAGLAFDLGAPVDGATTNDTSLERRRLWRRVVAPYRGAVAQLKPLRILCVLPLTRHPTHEPFGAAVSANATPFLVVLDEVWYRENGHEESVQAYIEYEPTEGKDTAPLYRAAPLPDHHVRPAGTDADPFYRDAGNPRVVDAPVQLNVFGPFGYTLDRADGESLANATAFVVYPPANVSAHWWVGVRLRRMLRSYRAGDAQFTVTPAPFASDVRHLYTLPGALVTQHSPTQPGTVTLQKSSALATVRDLTLQLEPVPSADNETRKIYRYLLLLGPTVFDASSGVDLFVPQQAVWLVPDDAGNVSWKRLSAVASEPANARYTGRIVELLLNGRYANPEDLFKNTASLQELFATLLPSVNANGTLDKPAQDAQAMARRVSDEFEVVIE